MDLKIKLHKEQKKVSINEEIDNTRTVRGQFTTTEVEGQTVGEEEEEA